MSAVPAPVARSLTGLFTLTLLAGVLALSGIFSPAGGPTVPAGPPGGPAERFHTGTAGAETVREPFCAGCHRVPPHTRSVSSRAMLNHHATRVHCLVCHGGGLVLMSEVVVRTDGILAPTVEGGAPTPARLKTWRERAMSEPGARCFPTGPGCTECHRAGGSLDWKGLGYDDRKAARLNKLEDYLLRTPADRWFFPSIL
jgi:hypothetical protein